MNNDQITIRKRRFKFGLYCVLGHRVRTKINAGAAFLECECGWEVIVIGPDASLIALGQHSEHELQARALREK